MEPTVRRARIADATEVFRIARVSWHETYDAFLGEDAVEEYVDQWYDIDDLEASIDSGVKREEETFLVAEVDEGYGTQDVEEYGSEIVGFADAGPDPENADVAYLFRIYVRPEVWGEGIGTALFEGIEAELGDSFDRFRLSVLAENDVGVSFVESMGFERVDTRESELDPDVEAHIYEKAF